jgi:hypothetical protein
MENTPTSKSSQDAKSEARDDRLTLRKNNEEVMRKKFQEESKKKCQWAFRALGQCAEKEGLLVLFNCRVENSIRKKSAD